GLRLGFMIVPETLKNDILKAKHSTDISTSGLIQRAFNRYIKSGAWDKHLKFMFDTYSERYFRIIDALDNCLPEGVSYLKPGGGLNIWLDLNPGFPVDLLVKKAAAKDVIFAPGR